MPFTSRRNEQSPCPLLIHFSTKATIIVIHGIRRLEELLTPFPQAVNLLLKHISTSISQVPTSAENCSFYDQFKCAMFLSKGEGIVTTTGSKREKMSRIRDENAFYWIAIFSARCPLSNRVQIVTIIGSSLAISQQKGVEWAELRMVVASIAPNFNRFTCAAYLAKREYHGITFPFSQYRYSASLAKRRGD